MTPSVRTRRAKQRVLIPRLQPPTKKQPPRDAAYVFRAFCQELADEIGFREREVYDCWEEIANIYEVELGARDMLDKRGQEPS